MPRKRIAPLSLAALAAAAGGALIATGSAAAGPPDQHQHYTATPIKHVVVIFQENVSFDHYFGTYPNAANTDGQTFHASAGTPQVNGLTPALLADNPNKSVS